MGFVSSLQWRSDFQLVHVVRTFTSLTYVSIRHAEHTLCQLLLLSRDVRIRCGLRFSSGRDTPHGCTSRMPMGSPRKGTLLASEVAESQWPTLSSDSVVFLCPCVCRPAFHARRNTLSNFLPSPDFEYLCLGLADAVFCCSARRVDLRPLTVPASDSNNGLFKR